MDEWSHWLIRSLAERAARDQLFTAGELAIVGQDEPRSPDWWADKLAGSPAADSIRRLAASAAFAARTKPEHIEDAVEIVGHQEARHLVFAKLVERLFPSRGQEWLAVAPRWRHTLAVAATSALLARLNRLPPGDSFVGGLLHDLGRHMLLEHGGRPYQRMGDGPQPLNAKELAARERKHLGFDHAQLSAAIAARLGASPAILSLLRDQLRLEALLLEVEEGPHLRRVAILDMAESLTAGLGYGPTGPTLLATDETQWTHTALVLSESPAGQILGLSPRRLLHLKERLEPAIRQVFSVARGGEGTLWDAPGPLEKILGQSTLHLPWALIPRLAWKGGDARRARHAPSHAILG